MLVVGAGPAGRAVAAACGERGLRTRLLDPAPGRPWRASYGAWRDELPADLPGTVLAATVRGRAIAVTEHPLDRDYAVFDVPALRAHLDQRLADADVTVERGRGSPDALPTAGLVIDAGGAAQPLSGGRSSRVAAEQTAVGVIVPAELAAPLLAPGEALFMDWRQTGGPGNWPTFLYAIPLAGDRVLLEETSLARRPGLDLDTLAARLRARLAAHGIRPPADAPREMVRFPLDLPRHRAAGSLGFGAAAPLTHPATGYQLAEALRLAPKVAGAAAGALGGSRTTALAAAEHVLWPAGARAVHLVRRRGLESLLRLPAARLPEFFEGFFRLPEASRRAYLSGRTDLRGTAAAMVGMFGTTGWPVRLRLIGSSLLVSAGPESATWSNVE
ncbi:MAG TPA: lycopene cyclase family protein [Pseudonocardia sp.]|nr:lycopene cyclase family protein [Pseudonocardia sp.]